MPHASSRLPPGGAKPEAATNHRNGTTSKGVLTDDGAVAIDVPRDREGTFAPGLIPKHERRFAGFDGNILALYPYVLHNGGTTCGFHLVRSDWANRPAFDAYKEWIGTHP